MGLLRPGIQHNPVPSISRSIVGSAQLAEELVSLRKGAETALHMTSPESQQTDVGFHEQEGFCRIIFSSRTTRICMTLSKSSADFTYKACVPSNFQANVLLHHRLQVQVIEHLQGIAASQVLDLQQTVDKRVGTSDPTTTTTGCIH